MSSEFGAEPRVKAGGDWRHGGIVDGRPVAAIELILAFLLDYAFAGAYQAILVSSVALAACSLVPLS